MSKQYFKMKTINVMVVRGVAGPSLYINDYRVHGSKPWGGGTMLYEFNVDIDEIDEALKPELTIRERPKKRRKKK